VTMTHRQFAESRKFCGLDLSPLMAALFDAAEGLPTVLDRATCVRHFGCPRAELPKSRPRTVAARTGGRAGKTSRGVATKALHAAWTVPLPTLRRGEVASGLLVAPDLKLARQALSFVKGFIEDSPTLRKALVGETKDSVDLRRPDGKTVRIEVLAATRGGRAVRGRTLFFAALDEAAFFFDEETGVVNDTEIYRAVLQRVVPGGQVWVVSTPWIEEVGLLEALIGKNFGVHEHALVLVAGTRALNPTWDPTGEVEADMRSQDAEAAAREIDGIPLSAGASAFFDPVAIKQAVDEDRMQTIKAPKGALVGNGNDLAFESDCSSHVEVARVGNRYELLAIEEQRPAKGKPLKPKAVVDAFAKMILSYGGKDFPSDVHYRAGVKEYLEPHALRFVDAPTGRDGKNECYLLTKRLLHEGLLRLPNHPRLLSQLRQVVSRPTQGGGFTISSPRGRGAGRTGHGDIVSALVLAVWHASEMRDMEGVSVGTLFFEPDPLAGMCAANPFDEARIPREWAAYGAPQSGVAHDGLHSSSPAVIRRNIH